MQAGSVSVVLGSTMLLLSIAQQLDILFGPFYVEPQDDAQRRFFERLIIDYYTQLLGGVCTGWTSRSNCGDKYGIPYHGPVPLEFHHAIPGSRLYYVSNYRHANDPWKRLANISAFADEAMKCILFCKKHHKEWHTANRLLARS